VQGSAPNRLESVTVGDETTEFDSHDEVGNRRTLTTTASLDETSVITHN
jgi:hypothetical protein